MERVASLQNYKWLSISWLLSHFLQISCFKRGELFSNPISEIFSIAGTCPTTRSAVSPRAPSPVFLICVFSSWTTTTFTVSTRKLSKVRKIFQCSFKNISMLMQKYFNVHAKIFHRREQNIWLKVWIISAWLTSLYLHVNYGEKIADCRIWSGAISSDKNSFSVPSVSPAEREKTSPGYWGSTHYDLSELIGQVLVSNSSTDTTATGYRVQAGSFSYS